MWGTLCFLSVKAETGFVQGHNFTCQTRRNVSPLSLDGRGKFTTEGADESYLEKRGQKMSNFHSGGKTAASLITGRGCSANVPNLPQMHGNSRLKKYQKMKNKCSKIEKMHPKWRKVTQNISPHNHQGGKFGKGCRNGRGKTWKP